MPFVCLCCAEDIYGFVDGPDRRSAMRIPRIRYKIFKLLLGQTEKRLHVHKCANIERGWHPCPHLLKINCDCGKVCEEAVEEMLKTNIIGDIVNQTV